MPLSGEPKVRSRIAPHGETGFRVASSLPINEMKAWSGARILQLVLPLVVAAVPVLAGEIWDSKDYTQWSLEDVNRLLMDSPWATQVSASFSAPHSEEEHLVIPPPGASTANMGGTRGVSDGRWDGGVGPNIDHSPPKLPVTVRWESALPVRQAWARSTVADHSMELREPGGLKENLNQPDKDYILAVVGLLASHQSSDSERVRRELIGAAKLVRTGKAPIRPEKVSLNAPEGAIQLFFPRTDPIVLDDKNVTFELQFGSMRVIKRFRLKPMIYKGRLAL